MNSPQRIVDGFVDRVYAGIDDEDALVIAAFMRELPATIPPEKSRAWDELSALVSDPDFEATMRRMAVESAVDNRIEFGLNVRPLILEHARPAVEADITPDSERGRMILNRIVPTELPAAEQHALLSWLAAVTDRRIERYWQLLDELNDHTPMPSNVPAFAWLAAALTAHR
ncbi:hypothetical protein [Nocardia sp. NBC_00511]|uniref:hypothetical protein n=1 Tax=Nocardia sp. NBC_00511 TaxID=2903591 RepID=UPI0030DFC0B0